MQVIECRGSGRARGQAHGEAARDLIADALQRWHDALGRATGDSPRRYLESFLAETHFVAICEALAPDLLEEVRGIAEAAHADLSDVLTYNFMDEQWWHLAEQGSGCSVLGATVSAGVQRKQATALLAQNMDLPSYLDGSQLLLHLETRAGSESMVLTAAGMIGLTGIARHGLGVCVNTMPMLTHSPAGLPVAFVLRTLLETPSFAQACKLVTEIPHASGQHYALAGPGVIRGFECSSDEVVEVAVAGGLLCHTNHPVTKRFDEGGSWRTSASSRGSTSAERLAFIRTAFQPGSGLEDVKRILADRSVPVSVTPTELRDTATFAAIAALISAEPSIYPPDLQICPGPPHLGTWEVMRWW